MNVAVICRDALALEMAMASVRLNWPDASLHAATTATAGLGILDRPVLRAPSHLPASHQRISIRSPVEMPGACLVTGALVGRQSCSIGATGSLQR